MAAEDLALGIFMEIRDSSSSTAPQNGGAYEFFGSLLGAGAIQNSELPSAFPLKSRRSRGRHLRYTYFRHLPPTNYVSFEQHFRFLLVSPLFSYHSSGIIPFTKGKELAYAQVS